MIICIACPEGHPVHLAAGRFDGEVLCPRCLTSFFASAGFAPSSNAKPEKGKARRPRDEDDDDEEDEKPAKKGKPAKGKKGKDAEEKPAQKSKSTKTKKDDDDKKPSAKPKPAKTKKDDEEDDDDEDEEEEEEEEEEIQWTGRKRQLNLCSKGLALIIAGIYLLVGFVVFSMLSVDYFELVEDQKGEVWRNGPAYYLFYFLAIPLIYLATGTLMVGMFMNLAVPPKVEGKGPLFAGIVFGGLVFLLAVVLLLTLFEVIVSDPVRYSRLLELVAGASILCFVVCFLATMGYLSKLLTFMRMQMESSQPITSGGFLMMCLAALLVVVYLGGMLKSNLGSWAGYVVAGVADGAGGFGIILMLSLVKLIQKLRLAIATYIRDG